MEQSPLRYYLRPTFTILNMVHIFGTPTLSHTYFHRKSLAKYFVLDCYTRGACHILTQHTGRDMQTLTGQFPSRCAVPTLFLLCLHRKRVVWYLLLRRVWYLLLGPPIRQSHSIRYHRVTIVYAKGAVYYLFHVSTKHLKWSCDYGTSYITCYAMPVISKFLHCPSQRTASIESSLARRVG